MSTIYPHFNEFNEYQNLIMPISEREIIALRDDRLLFEYIIRFHRTNAEISHKFVENVKIWWKNQFLNQKNFHRQVYTNIIWKSNHSSFQNGLSLILIMIGSHFMVQNVSEDGQKRQIPIYLCDFRWFWENDIKSTSVACSSPNSANQFQIGCTTRESNQIYPRFCHSGPG